MKDLLSFIKSTGIYLIGNVLIKLISFLLLPLYTKYINPADYGNYDLYIAYIQFVCSIVFLDIWGAIMRFMFDYKEDDEKVKPICAGLTIFVISSIIYTFIVWIAGAYMRVEYLYLLFLYGILMNLQNVFGYIARGLNKNILYTSAGLLGSLVTVLCNIWFIAYLKCGYQALYISSCIGYAVNITLILSGINIKELFRYKVFDKNLFKSMVIFSIPLCLNSVAYWFMSSYNKVVISNVLSIYENGLYAVASKFGVIISLFTQCFQMAWQELTFSKAEISKNKREKFYTTALNEYVKFLGFGLLMLLPFINIIFKHMIDISYYDAKSIIPFFMIATFMSAISSFLASIFSTLKKTNVVFTTTLIGSIVNVVMVHLLIGRLGVQAASIALFLGFTANVIRRIVVLKKYIDIKLDYKLFSLLTLIITVDTLIYFYGGILINIILLIAMIISFLLVYRCKIMGIIGAVLLKVHR